MLSGLKDKDKVGRDKAIEMNIATKVSGDNVDKSEIEILHPESHIQILMRLLPSLMINSTKMSILAKVVQTLQLK